MNALLHWLAAPEWSQLVKALLHSLWQGVLIAAVLAVLMRRVANPHWRYRLALLALVMIPTAGILTWAATSPPHRPLSPMTPPIPHETIPTPEFSGKPQTTLVLLSQRSPAPPPSSWTAWLALLWIIGASTMLGRASVKLAGAERLRRSCQPCDNPQVTQLLVEARRAIGLARKVRLAVTDKLTSPAVVGVLVPTLVLPLTLLTTLTPEQIRFILLHELAHIRRGDYFANLFQFFLEAVLFFNPAVWWLSHQVRLEREACCDALAIELSGAPADYARTLVHVAENALNPPPAAAPAFGNEREPSSLSDRVHRLLVPGYRPSLRLTWRAMIAAFAVGGLLLMLCAEGTRLAVAQVAKSSEDTNHSTVPAHSKATSPPGNLPDPSNHLTTEFKLGGPIPPDSFGYHIPVQWMGTNRSELERAERNLQELRFKLVSCSNQPLEELLRELAAASKKSDPAGNGFKFLVLPFQLNSSVVTLHPPLTNANLLEILAALQGIPRLQITRLDDKGRMTLRPDAPSVVLDDVTRRSGPELERKNSNDPTSNRVDASNEPSATEDRVRRAGDRATLVNPLHAQGITYERWRNGHTNASPTTAITNPFSSSNPPPIRVEGLNEHSRVEHDVAAGRTVATNGGIVRFQDTVVRADRIELDQKTGTLIANGNFRVEAPGLTNNAARIEMSISDYSSSAQWPTPSNGGRKVIKDQLNQTILEKVEFNSEPLSNVVRTIIIQARQRDPQGNGINVLINPGTFALEDGRVVDVGSLPITISPPLTKVRLGEALEAVLNVAKPPIEISIEDYAVVISLKTEEPPKLLLREFKLDPAVFARRLAELGFRVEASASATNNHALAPALRGFFAQLGVDLDPNLGKSVFYHDRGGILLVRATREELDTIESALQVLNKPTPQVNIKARFVEIPACLMDSVLEDVLETNRPSNYGWASILSKAQADELTKQLKAAPGSSFLSESEVTTVSGRQAQMQTGEMRTIATAINPKALSPPGITSTTKGGSNESLLITTNLVVGTMVDVLPAIMSDGRNVALTVIPRMTEFLGYTDVKHPDNSVVVYVNGKKEKTAYPSPQLRTLQMTNSAIFSDGMTLLMGIAPVERTTLFKSKVPLLGDIPGIGRLFRTESSQVSTNILLVFVTPEILNPAAPSITTVKGQEGVPTPTNLHPTIDRKLPRN